MKKKIFLAKISTVLAALVLCLSVFAFVSLDKGLAWFSKNREVQANGMKINVQELDPVPVTATFYHALSVDGETITFNLEKEESAVLPQFDLLEEKTRYLLMKLTATENYQLTISTHTNYLLDKDKPLLGGSGEREDYSNWISNVLFFEQVTPANDGVVTLSSRQTFWQNNTFTEIDPYKPTAAGDDYVLYLVIGYDEELMARLFSENIGNPVVLDGVKFVKDCDFTLSLGGA